MSYSYCRCTACYHPIRSGEIPGLRYHGKDYDDIYPDIPSDEEVYGISEEDWENLEAQDGKDGGAE